MSSNASIRSESPVCAACGTPLVAQLGGQCPRCLLGLAEGVDRSVETAEARTAPRGMLGRPFGDYELVEEIARGGMGVVYRAHQRSLNREVALKMILAGELAGPESLRMFQREAHAAASLHHPNIVPVYEIGEHELQHYFTMRLVPGGRTIADWAAGRRGQWREVATATAQAARAVAFAHSHGVLHRDLKPSNILWDDATGPQVTDFGLAKLLDRAEAGATISARILGSPNYMAPEQAGGGGARITTATDVFGLGAVLFELLAGRPPFQGTSVLDTMRRAAEEAPAPLPDLPVDLRTICLKCLEKEPEQRYRSAAALADDLERWLRDEPIAARPATSVERLTKWVRRRPVHATLAATATVGLIVLVVGQLFHTRRTNEARHTAEAANRRLAGELRRVEWQQAEEALTAGRTPDGMAALARFLRETPTDIAVAARLRSLLELRAFPLPAMLPLKHGKAVTRCQMDANQQRLFTLTADGTLRSWYLTNGSMEQEIRADLGNRTLNVLPGDRLLLQSSTGRFRVWNSRRWQAEHDLGESDAAADNWGLSNDGRWVSLVSTRSEIESWDTTTGRRFASIHPPLPEMLIAGTVGPAGETLLRGARHGLWLWRPATGALAPLLDADQPTKSAHSDWPRQRAYACLGIEGGPATNLLVSLDLSTGRSVLRQPGERNWTQLQSSPDGSRLLVSVWGGGATVMRAATLTPLIPWFGQAPFQANVCADARFQVGFRALHDGTGRIHDLNFGGPLMEPVQHAGAITSHQLTTDGRRLVTASQDGTARLWEVGMRLPNSTWNHAGSWVYCAALSPDGTRLVAALDRELRFYDLTTGAQVLRAPVSGDIVHHVAFSPDGRLVSAGCFDKSVCVTEAETGRVLWRNSEFSARVFRARFSPDGQRVAASSEDGSIRIFEALTGRLVFSPMRHEGEVTEITFSPDSRHLASASVDATARVWDLATGGQVGAPFVHLGTVWSVEFSPDGRRLLTASTDRTAQIWDVASGARLGATIRADQALRGATWNADGRQVLIYTLNGARVYAADTGRPLTQLMRHSERVVMATFSPDGRWIGTASDDQTARVWEAATGFPVTEPLGGDVRTTSLLWEKDGRHFLTASKNGNLLRWRSPEAKPGPAWLSDLAESLAGKRSEPGGGSVPVTVDRLAELRRQAASPGDDADQRWLHWFLVRRLEAPDSRPEVEN